MSAMKKMGKALCVISLIVAGACALSCGASAFGINMSEKVQLSEQHGKIVKIVVGIAGLITLVCAFRYMTMKRGGKRGGKKQKFVEEFDQTFQELAEEQFETEEFQGEDFETEEFQTEEFQTEEFQTEEQFEDAQ
jgi:hypothetical protein